MIKKIHYNAPVILTFTFLAFFVYLLGEWTKNSSTMLLFSVYRSSLKDPLFYIRLFGHVLGHANWEHYMNNFLLILLIGPMLEEKYGSENMLIMIVFTAFVTGIINILFFKTALLGASGIVFMLILLSSFANIKKGTIPLTLLIVVIIFMGKEVIAGLFYKDAVSQLTHIIGGFCGGLFGYKINRSKI
ncbi:rhomboid family intramembrane serine protease [Defluviitalea saccharophila]|uniref:Rhomboid family intramembrane serine protease n=1 Tax=Defluviitalea saccharophila TaxID=879970 RepID=A0ABZ2Y846_9FIRM|nr:rhomboid family intramembrane serine protease [Candidatus Epulonipiscium sp.]